MPATKCACKKCDCKVCIFYAGKQNETIICDECLTSLDDKHRSPDVLKKETK